MPSLAQRAAAVRPSPTMSAGARAAALRASGVDLVPLVTGLPDFHTPEVVKQAGIDAILANQTRYTEGEGSPALRAELAGKFQRENGLNTAAAEVLVASGSKPLLHAAIHVLADPGDEVIVPAPYWVSYPSIVKIAGAQPVVLPTLADYGFKLQPAALATAITPRTRVLILNTPNNPTGAVYSRAELLALYEVLQAHPEVWVVTDEIYEHVNHGSVDFVSPASISAAAQARTFTINGFSKSHAMTGWRLGFAAGPAEVVQAISVVLGHIAGAPNTISQAAAVVALREGEAERERNRITYRERYDTVLAALQDVPGLRTVPTGGAFYFYIDISALIGRRRTDGSVIGSDVDFAAALQADAGVSVLAGQAFGLSPFVRLSYAQELPRLVEGLTRLKAFVLSLKAD